jgi:hypothetical protein
MQHVYRHFSGATDTNTTIEQQHVLCGPCRDVISRTVWSNELVFLWSESLGTRDHILLLRIAGSRWRYSTSPDPGKTSLAKTSSIYRSQTCPLVREGAPQKQDRNCQTVINIWSWIPDGARHQDWLTGRQSQYDFDNELLVGWSSQQFSWNQTVKRRLGDWCELAASLGRS